MSSMNQQTVIPAPMGGVRPDLSRFEIPMDSLYDSLNLLPTDGELHVRPGLTPLYPPVGEHPSWFADLGRFGFKEFVVLTAEHLYRLNDGFNAWESLNPAGVTLNGSSLVGDGTLFETSGNFHFIATNHADKMIDWTFGDAEFVFMDYVPIIAKTVATIADRIAATTDDELWFSEVMDHTAGWGDFIIRFGDTTGDIVAVRKFGTTSGIVYKSDAIYRLIPQVSLDAPFRSQAIALDIPGPVGQDCITTLPDGTHLYIGADGGLYSCNGTQVSEIVRNVGVWIRENKLFSNLEKTFLWYDAEFSRVWIFLSEGGVTFDKALVVKDGTIWPQLFPIPLAVTSRGSIVEGVRIDECRTPLDICGDRTIDSNTTERPAFLVGDIRGQFYDLSDTTEGTIEEEIDVFFETGVLSLAGSLGTVTLLEVEHLVELENRTIITVDAGSSDWGSEPIYSQQVSIELPNWRRPLTQFRLTGSAFVLKISARTRGKFGYTALTCAWRPRGYR